jgi:hydroxymethylpyrimidine pyrophosphatase-like HAD family hydrolase
LPKLISFDIDGTLEVGDPPGDITMDLVRMAQQLGYLIGSCSDRTLSAQQRIWSDHLIVVDFTVSHQLSWVKTPFTQRSITTSVTAKWTVTSAARLDFASCCQMRPCIAC